MGFLESLEEVQEPVSVAESRGTEVLLLSGELVYEVLARVDALTLAKASCVSPEFRNFCADEALWERLCTARWPSTKEPSVKSIVSSMGGFRKLFASCYPLILTKEAETLKDEKMRWKADSETGWDCGDDELDGDEEVVASDFISIIDVVYNGKSVLSRTIEGIPETGDFVADWFSVCPFSFDVLRDLEERDYGFSLDEDEGLNSVATRADFPVVASLAKERTNIKPWKILLENIRMSWILVRKSTKQMINLASWKPLEGGTCGWPYEEDFVLQFGSVLPPKHSNAGGPNKCSNTKTTASSASIQCNIILKCKLSTVAGRSTGGDPWYSPDSKTTTLWMTELSMQLKNMESATLNGRNSLATLSRALTTRDKTRDHCKLVQSYNACLRRKSQLKENKIRRETRLDTAIAISGICIFICLNYMFFFLRSTRY